jgi:divalent metal cation (Fe/Co/Zn/Cd) transporter
MSYKLAVRKIMKSRKALRDLYITSILSVALAVLGFLIYVIIFPSDVILVEAFVWLIEGFSFFGLAIAFHIASSRATMYRSRFEVLRIEALSTLFLSLIAVVVLLLVVRKSVRGEKSTTPIILSLYPLASALVSYLLERFLHRSMHYYEVRLASIRTVASKLSLDVVFEVAGGLSIIASNLLHNPVIETAIVVLVGAYTLYVLSGIFYESLAYLVGLGPRSEINRIREQIERLLEKSDRFKLRSLKVEMYGTFGEAEVWVEAPPHLSLAEASRESVGIARRLVSSIPELLRALVIMVPSINGSRRTKSLRREKKPRRKTKPKPRHYTRDKGAPRKEEHP